MTGKKYTHVRIGKYISSKKIIYADLDIVITGDFYEEVAALRDNIDALLSQKKTCTLEEFHRDDEVYMYTNSRHHKKEFGMDKPFWLVVEQNGCFLNLDALIMIKRNSNN